MITPQSAIDVNLLTKETFNITSNGKNFILNLSYNEIIIVFEVEEKDKFPKEEYSIILGLTELTKIDRFFRQFDNIKEAFDSLKVIIINKKISIIKQEQSMIIKIKNNLNNKDICINIQSKEKEEKKEISTIINYISSLNNRIIYLENQIKEMKNNYDKRISYLEKIINNNLIMFKESKIVQSNEIDLILSWFDKKPKSFNLLLDVNIDDNFLNNFFEKCENKCPTMIFIKTTDNLRFGGFTNKIWPKDGIEKDEKSFLFSLSKRQKYKIKDQNNAISASENNWISFGYGMDLYLYNHLSSQGGGTSKFYYDIPGSHYLNGSKSDFKLLNCEIYEIEY